MYLIVLILQLLVYVYCQNATEHFKIESAPNKCSFIIILNDVRFFVKGEVLLKKALMKQVAKMETLKCDSKWAVLLFGFVLH